MSRFFRALFALAVLLLPGAAAGLQVAATLPGLGAIAREVGGPEVSVTVLSSARQDPHFVDPRPDLVVKLNRADFLVANGLDLEVGWLPPLVTGARNPRIAPGATGYLDASTLVRKLEVAGGPIDRSQGDIHPGGNPHYLYDPRAAAAVARGVGERLAALDPENGDGYRGRALALATRLEALADETAARFRALPEDARRVVVYHRSFPYLEDWLGLERVAEIEPKPGIQPHPAHLAGVLATMRERGARVILQEEFYPAGSARSLAGLAKARLVLLPAGPGPKEELASWHRRLADDLYRSLESGAGRSGARP